MALALLELGFEKNDRLFVMLPNCSQNAILIFVAAKLGLVKVHGDPHSMSFELPTVLSKIDCKGIVMMADETTLNQFQELSQNFPPVKHIILVGSNKTIMPNAHAYDELIQQGETQKIEKQEMLAKHQASVEPDSPLAIILTSGSTGVPERVVLTNFSVFNTLCTHQNYFGSSFARICITQSMSHILTGIMITLAPAINTITIVCPSFNFDVTAAMRSIDQEKCTSLLGSPIFFRRLLADPDRSKYDLASLKHVILGSTLVQSKLMQQIQAELPNTLIGQTFALTEGGCSLTNSMRCRDERRFTSIGQCLPHLELKLVDENNQVVPIGCQGEICVRGYSLMCGYYDDPEETAKTITESGWLKTGDLATMDEDGYLFYVERKKHLIFKNDGTIVFPNEVEQTIEEYDCVERAHVFTIHDSRVKGIVCAFVKIKDGQTCEADELKRFLATKLVDYKIPEHIRFVDEFPRTSIGKVPKHQLAKDMMKILNL